MARAGEAGGVDLFVIVYRLITYTSSFLMNYGWLMILYIVFLILSGYIKSDRKQILQTSLIFELGVFVAVYSMILSPSFPPRAWFGVVTYSIIAIGILLYNFDRELPVVKQLKICIVVVSIIAFSFSFIEAFNDIYSYWKVVNNRSIQVVNEKREGKTSTKFERYIGKTKYLHVEDPYAYQYMYGYYGINVVF